MSASTKSKTEFILGLGASQHISNNVWSLTSLKDFKPVSFHLVDDGILQTKRQGSVINNLYSRNNDGQTATTLMLRKVLYIARGAVSMLSCIQLDQAYISSIFSDCEWPLLA